MGGRLVQRRGASHLVAPPHSLQPLLLLLVALVLVLAATAAPAAKHFETLIVGCGPAGLQMGYLLSRASRDFTIVEQASSCGSFFRQYPRHRRLVSINKVGTGSPDPEFSERHDWNSLLSDPDDPRGRLLMQNYTHELFPHADMYLAYLSDYAARYELLPHILFNTRITTVDRKSPTDTDPATPNFTLHAVNLTSDTHLTITARTLVVATNANRPSYPRAALGIAEHTIGYEDFDPHNLTRFYNKRVLILGASNSAFEVANSISGVANVVEMCSRSPVQFSWRTHYAGDIRAINAAFLDMYQLKSQHYLTTCVVSEHSTFARRPDGSIEVDLPVTGLDDYDLDAIRHKEFSGKSRLRRGGANSQSFDEIVRCLGFEFDRSMFTAQARPRVDRRHRYPLLTPLWESVNVPDMYFAGSLMAGRDAKRSAVFAVHGFRYAVRNLFHTLERVYHGRPWPSRNIPHSAAELAGAILERAQYSSALYQTYGTMCELFVFTPVAEGPPHWTHYREMQCDYIFTNPSLQQKFFITLSLEYHPDFSNGKVDVFDGPHPQLHPSEGWTNRFLHPVVRAFSGLKFDKTRDTAFDAVEPDKAGSGEPVTRWQGNEGRPPALATHHVMETVFIDFAHLEDHIEPLVRFLAGLLATRPELLDNPLDSPIFHVKFREFGDPSRLRNLHPQQWVADTYNTTFADLEHAHRTLRQQVGSYTGPREPQWSLNVAFDNNQGPPADGEDEDGAGQSDTDRLNNGDAELMRKLAAQYTSGGAAVGQGALEDDLLQGLRSKLGNIMRGTTPGPEDDSDEGEEVEEGEETWAGNDEGWEQDDGDDELDGMRKRWGVRKPPSEEEMDEEEEAGPETVEDDHEHEHEHDHEREVPGLPGVSAAELRELKKTLRATKQGLRGAAASAPSSSPSSPPSGDSLSDEEFQSADALGKLLEETTAKLKAMADANEAKVEEKRRMADKLRPPEEMGGAEAARQARQARQAKSKGGAKKGGTKSRKARKKK